MAPYDIIVLNPYFPALFGLNVAVASIGIILSAIIFVKLQQHRNLKIVKGRGPDQMYYLFWSVIANELLAILTGVMLWFRVPLVYIWVVVNLRHWVSIVSFMSFVSFQIIIRHIHFMLPGRRVAWFIDAFWLRQNMRSTLLIVTSFTVLLYLPIVVIGIFNAATSFPNSVVSTITPPVLYLVLILVYFGIMFATWWIYLILNRDFDRHYSHQRPNIAASVLAFVMLLITLVIELGLFKAANGNIVYFDGVQMVDAICDSVSLVGSFVIMSAIPFYAIVTGNTQWIQFYETYDGVRTSERRSSNLSGGISPSSHSNQPVSLESPDAVSPSSHSNRGESLELS
jgi:hypothetical protein